MKRFPFTFRILLLTLAFGLAVVPFLNYWSERWNSIDVNLPQIKSESPLYVEPRQNIPNLWNQNDEIEIPVESRDLSAYDLGGEASNCKNISETELTKCERKSKTVRDFLWNNWQKKKLAYVIYTVSGRDAGVEFYIFIEPDENGDWHMLWRGERSGVMRVNRGTVIEDVRNVKCKRAGTDDEFYKNGTVYLSFLDQNGKEVERW